MVDPVSKKGFGNAALARQVIDAYVQGTPCWEYLGEETKWGAEEAQIEKSLCEVLKNESRMAVVLYVETSAIEPQEKVKLGASGFSQEFISELAGPDGRRALRERAKWLADHMMTPWYRPNLPTPERKEMLEELGYYSQDAAVALSPLLEIVEEGSSLPLLAPAIQILGQLGPKAKESIPHLKRIYLREPMEEMPKAVSEILSDDVFSLLQDLNHENPSIRKLAYRALFFIGFKDSGTVAALIEKIKTDPELRDEAIASLRGQGKPAKKATPLLTEIYRDPNTHNVTRFVIVETLLGIEDSGKESLSVLEDFLGRDVDILTRKSIVGGGLAQLGRPALPILFKTLGNKDLRVTAAKAIKEISLAVEDIEPLMALKGLDDFHRISQESSALMHALANIGADATLPLVRILKDAEGIRYTLAIDSLKALGEKVSAVAPELYALARDFKKQYIKFDRLNDLEKAIDIMEIFPHIGSNALPVLVGGLKDKDSDMTYLCLSTIHNIGREAKEAAPTVLLFLENPDPSFRSFAISTLQNIAPGNRTVLMKIIERLQDTNSDVRWSAARSLREMAFHDVSPHIYLALPLLITLHSNTREEERVRTTAKDAIQAIEEKVL